jgi:hypothetical protein
MNLPAYFNDGYAELLQVFHHQPIGTGYTARRTRDQQRRLRDLQRAMAGGGELFARRMRELGVTNVIINPRSVVPAEQWNCLAGLDLSASGLNVIDLRDEAARDGGGYAGPVQYTGEFPSCEPSRRIEVHSAAADRFLWYGWGGAEAESRWTVRNGAAVIFALRARGAGSLRMRMAAYLVPGKLERQSVFVDLNGRRIGVITIDEPALSDHTLPLPDGALRETNVLRFFLPDADSPADLGAGDEERFLGVRVAWVEFTPGASPGSQPPEGPAPGDLQAPRPDPDAPARQVSRLVPGFQSPDV